MKKPFLLFSKAIIDSNKCTNQIIVEEYNDTIEIISFVVFYRPHTFIKMNVFKNNKKMVIYLNCCDFGCFIGFEPIPH